MLLTGCTGEPGVGAARATAAGASVEPLVVWMVGDDKVTRTLVPAVKAMQEAHPGLRVEVRDIPWSDVMSKYSAALASREGPDVITGGTTIGIDLGTKGALIDLSREAPDVVATLEKYAAPGVMRSVRRPGGPLYAGPFDMNLQLLYHRTDLMPQAPATYAEFEQRIREHRARGGRGYVQQWGNTTWLGWAPYLMQHGGWFYDAGCTRSTVASPEAVQSLRYYAGLYREFKLATDGWPDADAGLESGAYSFFQSGTWMLSAIPVVRPKLKDRWAAAPLPAGPLGTHGGYIGGTVIGVTTFSPRKALALDFLRIVYRGDVALAMAEVALDQGLFWLPAGRVDQIAALSLPQQQKDTLMKQMAQSQSAPPCPGWQRLAHNVTRAVQTVVLSGADPQAALNEAAAKLDGGLRRGR